MSSNLVRYATDRLPREVSRELDRVRDRALVRAGRVQAVEFVAKVGMIGVASLTELEGSLISSVPLAEPRLRTIGDAAAIAIANEIAGMAW